MTRRDALKLSATVVAGVVSPVQVELHVELRDFDVIVFRHPSRMTDHSICYIQKSLARMFPNNVTLVLDEGASLEIARPKAEIRDDRQG